MRPDVDNPKLPFNTRAGGKEVIYQDGYKPETTPNITDRVSNKTARDICFNGFTSAIINERTSVLLNPQTMKNASIQAIRLIPIASETRVKRRLPT